MRRRVPWLLECKLLYLEREMVTHYLEYLETRKKYATGETAELTVSLITKLQARIRKHFNHL